jgi:glyoxalase family protein
MAEHGIHHVTAIAGEAHRNLDFYTRVLGLRLVKKTVNFDDPGTYHLYFGDETGRPGTILTFFPWAHVAPGRAGGGETAETAFRIPRGALGDWTHRLVSFGVPHGPPEKRFGETVLPFRDPDGMRLALVTVQDAENEAGWSDGTMPVEMAIRGFHGVTLTLGETGPTGAVLSDVLGFTETGRDGALIRFDSGTALGGVVDLRADPEAGPARLGGGSVHHVAFRAASDAEQGEMTRRLAEGHGLHATEQVDRNYFRSVYFREPGGVLFEIATDDPGFAADEPVSSLGQALKLPPRLEPRRREIEAVLA